MFWTVSHIRNREMLAVLVVCEWSYLTWGQKVQDTTNRDDFVTYEWVDLHSGEFFESVVDYLRGLLDKEGTLIDETDKQACQERFLQAIQLEEDFFNHAYSS
jgi:thiaminase/transcriptional activator TenA